MPVDSIRCRCCKKPPLGVKPRWCHEEERIRELKGAINRYTESDSLVPQEWIEEYNELIKRKNSRTA